MNLLSVLALGFFLGMRHATDADHVVAVSAIVTRERTLRAAAPIGLLWGIGHTITILLVGGAIVVFGIVIPPHVGLGMELSVAVMLVLLGSLTVRSVIRDARRVARAGAADASHSHEMDVPSRARSLRPLFVGVVHGLAGSAAVALLVLGVVRNAVWAIGYLLVFGVGTIAGMLLITSALAMPIAAAARRVERLHWSLGVVTGFASIVFGAVLAYQIGFVDGLFTGRPEWTPH